MAQIVTITNPLTGQPAQVDQLDHTAQEIDDAIARALPGGEIDITLANKAPAGYGLGGTAKKLTDADDLNNIKTTGWYCYHRNKQPANVPTPEVYSAVMEVIFGNFSGQTLQRVYSTGDDKDWNLVAQRVCYGSGGWQPWEWVNPPMQLGGEYRTTERYLGKPVYAKARTYTFTSSYDSASQFGLEIPHEISNFGSLVRAEAVSPPYMIPYVSKNGGFAGVRAVNATNILFDSYKTGWSSGNKITFKLFYTKS